jgi:hypothetical protein
MTAERRELIQDPFYRYHRSMAWNTRVSDSHCPVAVTLSMTGGFDTKLTVKREGQADGYLCSGRQHLYRT